MLREDDLNRFREHFRESVALQRPPVSPTSALQARNGLFPEEIRQLVRSLQIAVVLGDADEREAIVASLIAEQLRDVQCVDLDQGPAWQQAIAWALVQSNVRASTQSFTDRSVQVGQACRRLRNAGHKITITAHGVQVSEQAHKKIAARIDWLAGHIGGADVASQACRIVKDCNLLHDGMWLLGDRVPSVGEKKSPAIPIGWIFSLGLRHLGKISKPRNPHTAWKSLTQLATDYAAALDCQRYSQYEDIQIGAADSWRVLRESLLWRELFSLAQVPALVIPSLRKAFSNLITSEDEKLLDWQYPAAFDEIEHLMPRCADDNLTIHSRGAMAQHYRNLWKIGVGEIGCVNNTYTNPNLGGERNQSDFIFFAHDNDKVLTLPRSFMREAFCQAAFKQLWRKLPSDRSSDLVGKIFEWTLAQACIGKAEHIYTAAKYNVNKQVFEMDVGTRQGNNVVLFETKAKSLTAQARSGNLIAFYSDFTDSYLALVQQLARHEDSLRSGLTPLTTKLDINQAFRPLKIAVSPLSYGPASDKVLASSLLLAFANKKLHPASSDPAAKKTVDSFNKIMGQIYDLAPKLAPRIKDDEINLHAYFLDLFWLDLGQVLYVLDRGNSVFDAFQPLRFVTFTTRDFWTEVAFADTQGLTSKYWRPLPV